MKLYIVTCGDEDDELVGVYSTMERAAQARANYGPGIIEIRILDKLPDEPEPREPDLNAPNDAERAERDSFDADRGVR